MIRIVISEPERVEADAVLRSVSEQLEAVTPAGTRMGRAAGTEVLDRLQGVGAVPVGGAVITPAGALPHAFLIHAVIQSRDEPVTGTGVQRALLNGLRRAAEWGIERLVLPPLGTGAGSLDAETSARLMIETVQGHMSVSEFPREVVIAVLNDYEEDAFRRELERTVPQGHRGGRS